MSEAVSTTEAKPAPMHNPTPLGNWMSTVIPELPRPSISGTGGNKPDGATTEKPPGADDAPNPGATTAPGPSQAAPAATAAPAAKAGEKGPDEIDDWPDEKWPRKAEDWKRFKESAKVKVTEREARIKTLESELTEVRAKIATAPSDPKELEALKKERDQLSELVQLHKVESHPRFKAYFDGKVGEQVGLAKEIVGAEHAEKIETILKQPASAYREQQIRELMGNLDDWQRVRLGGVYNKLAEINHERQGEISRARENAEKIQADEQNKAAQTRAQAEKIAADMFQQVQDKTKGLPQFQKRDNDEGWNKGVEQRLTAATNLLQGKDLDVAGVVRAALDAVSLPVILEDNKNLRGHIAKLEAQIASLSAAVPAPNGERTRTGAETTQTVTNKPGSRPMEVTAGWIKGLQAARNAE